MAKSKKMTKGSSENLVVQLKKQLKDTNTLWESKYKVLKGQVEAVAEESYIRGYRDAIMDQAELDEAFDNFMEKAAGEFEKKHLKALKSDQPKGKAKAKKKARKTKRT